MAKILKNVTGSDISILDTGTTIAANSQYTISEQSYLLWAASANIVAHVNSGNIVVNDGINDITNTARALNFIKYPDTAFNARFLSEPERSNGFASKNIQEAIEEIKNTAIGSGGNVMFFNDGGTENKWLQVYEHHSQASGPFNPTPVDPDDNKDIIPYIVPHHMSLVSLTYVNKKDRTETDIEIYRNGTLVYTWQIRDSRWRVKNTGLSALTFLPADKISVFARKFNNAIEKPDDLMFMMYYTITKVSNIDYGDSDFV